MTSFKLPTKQAKSTPIVVSVAGSDCSGGAGLQADLKTAAAFGVHACTVVTAVTAQNSRAVYDVLPMPLDVVKAQLDAILDDYAVSAFKLGMLSDASVAALLVEYLDQLSVPVVIDPVIKATVGRPLFELESIEAYTSELIPRATVLTPNLPEAALLLAAEEACTEAEAEQQSLDLLGFGAEAILLKGGHGRGQRVTDYLATNEGVKTYVSPRVDTNCTHGGGCTLAMGVAAGLAQNLSIVQAVSTAKTYMQGAIKNSERLQIAKENGPIHHFYQYW